MLRFITPDELSSIFAKHDYCFCPVTIRDKTTNETIVEYDIVCNNVHNQFGKLLLWNDNIGLNGFPVMKIDYRNIEKIEYDEKFYEDGDNDFLRFFIQENSDTKEYQFTCLPLK